MKANLPPGDGPGLPILGHTLAMLKNGFAFVEEGARRHGPISPAARIGKATAVVTEPEASGLFIDSEECSGQEDPGQSGRLGAGGGARRRVRRAARAAGGRQGPRSLADVAGDARSGGHGHQRPGAPGPPARQPEPRRPGGFRKRLPRTRAVRDGADRARARLDGRDPPRRGGTSSTCTRAATASESSCPSSFYTVTGKVPPERHDALARASASPRCGANTESERIFADDATTAIQRRGIPAFLLEVGGGQPSISAAASRCRRTPCGAISGAGRRARRARTSAGCTRKAIFTGYRI